MKSIHFEISEEKLATLLKSFPNMGKNGDVGKMAVELVKEYFLSLDDKASFITGKKGIDIQVTYLGLTENYEVKGTADNSIAWSKLKVSSQDCFNLLANGMQLIRVTDVGKTKITLYFMEYGIDFVLKSEARWSVKKIIGSPAEQSSTIKVLS